MAKGKKGRPGSPPGKAGKGRGPAKPPGPKPAAKGPSGGSTAAAAVRDHSPQAGAPPGAPAKLTRLERLEAERQARRRRSRLVRIAIAVAVALIAGLVAFLATAGRRAEQAAVAKMTTGSCRFDRKADRDDGQGRNHFAGGRPTYSVDPPAGGNHVEQVAPPGVYQPNGLPPDARVVHAMEHGYVVLWRAVDLSTEDETTIKAVSDRFQGKVLVVPRPSLTVPVAATAWHRRLICGKVEEQPLSRFVRTFLDKGPEKGFVNRT